MSASRPVRRPADLEGWQGWDDYARFYDWENAQTMGRRDVRFWQNLARQVGGRLLELGCGTGRVSLPLAKAGAHVVGIDRSASMLARARKRIRLSKLPVRPQLVRGDIRFLPFPAGSFRLVAAPYGILQSLLDEVALDATIADVARVLAPGGAFAIDMVSDLPAWQEYERRVKLRGKMRGSQTQITLVESVRQDRVRGLTTFDQEFVERRGTKRHTHQFSLSFRTVSVEAMTERLERAGFRVTAVLGDYDGGPWDPRADVWLILAVRDKAQTLDDKAKSVAAKLNR
jgi:ubiquinone/menaquinone biosynthesis C-methylase UbiE